MARGELPAQAVIDGFGQAVLIFDQDGNLAMENAAAGRIFGPDMTLLRGRGWQAAALLFDARAADLDNTLDAIRERAFVTGTPTRFHVLRGGEYIPCWASVVTDAEGNAYSIITVETPDWSALQEIVDQYLGEVRAAVEATRGHASLITQSIKKPRKIGQTTETVEQLGKRISGFTRVIDTHMHRLDTLTTMMERLERIRTAQVGADVERTKRKIVLEDFFEDFIEELDERLIDPESDAKEYRARLKTSVPGGVVAAASPPHLTAVLRDMLRNAIMYSMKATPVLIAVRKLDDAVQIDVLDEGYGVRASEVDRVFAPFQRARQPQIIGEAGYGLSLYLCKHEIEAMHGRLWFESEEGIGSTFSVKLPIWRDLSSSASERM